MTPPNNGMVMGSGDAPHPSPARPNPPSVNGGRPGRPQGALKRMPTQYEMQMMSGPLQLPISPDGSQTVNPPVLMGMPNYNPFSGSWR